MHAYCVPVFMCSFHLVLQFLHLSTNLSQVRSFPIVYQIFTCNIQAGAGHECIAWYVHAMSKGKQCPRVWAYQLCRYQVYLAYQQSWGIYFMKVIYYTYYFYKSNYITVSYILLYQKSNNFVILATYFQK